MCIRIYIFNFKKQTSKKKQSKAGTQKNAKETKKEKRIFPENQLQKSKFRPPG